MIARILRGVIAIASGSFALFVSTPASAQRWLPAAMAEVSSGAEGGGGRNVAITRAATRLRIGGELRVDEDLSNAFGIAAIVDIEPRARFGADLRYVHAFEGQRFALSIGALGYITPGTAIGPAATFEYRHPLSKVLWLTAGPEVNVLVFGIDVPDKTVIWQTILHVGMRVDL